MNFHGKDRAYSYANHIQRNSKRNGTYERTSCIGRERGVKVCNDQQWLSDRDHSELFSWCKDFLCTQTGCMGVNREAL